MQSLSAVKAASPMNTAGAFAFRMHPAPSPTDHIDQIGTEVPFARNGQFYCEGEPATYLYRIISGVARIYRMTTEGRRQIVAFYVPGDLFGFEAGAVGGEPLGVTVAQGDLVCGQCALLAEHLESLAK